MKLHVRLKQPTQLYKTSARVTFQFDKMASSSGERVLVYLKKQHSDTFEKAHFTEVKLPFCLVRICINIL